MDSRQNFLGEEIPSAGRHIRRLLQQALCPAFVRDADTVALASPWEEGDFRVGIYLYDIQDHSILQPRPVTLTEERRRYPPKAVELSYLLFCNEKNRFGGNDSERSQIILNEMIRTIYDFPTVGDEDVIQLSFAKESQDFKIELWNSFQKPLQPAVYIRAVPVLIASKRVEEISPVKDREYSVNRKEQGREK